MSEVMKCDVCGTVYEKECKNSCVEERWANGANLYKYDLCRICSLCPACVERFHQWLDSSANEKEVVSADNGPTVKEIDQEHNYIRWVDDLASNTRKVYSTRPLTREEQDAIIVEWTELKIPFNIEFVDPGEI